MRSRPSRRSSRRRSRSRSTANTGSASPAALMVKRCGVCSTCWSGDDSRPLWRTGLACGWTNGHAARHDRPVSASPGGPAARLGDELGKFRFPRAAHTRQDDEGLREKRGNVSRDELRLELKASAAAVIDHGGARGFRSRGLYLGGVHCSPQDCLVVKKICRQQVRAHCHAIPVTEVRRFHNASLVTSN
jgi:hypothetical protein